MVKVKIKSIIKYGNNSWYYKIILKFKKFISDISNNPMLNVKMESILKKI